jgi:uroporphyrinogen-III decarboxylase
MDLSEARKTLPEQLLGGNVDLNLFLFPGNREKVVTDTRACVHDTDPGRFTQMSGCGIPRNMSPENMKAMVDRAIKYDVA